MTMEMNMNTKDIDELEAYSFLWYTLSVSLVMFYIYLKSLT